MIAAFDDKLRQANIELTPREIAEAIFLASRMGPSVRLASPKPPDPPPPDEQKERAKTHTDPVKPADPAPLAKEGDLFPSRSATQSATGGVPAAGIRAATAIALPGARAIGRALRPLLRRHPSRTRRELDIERTIEAIADAGVNLVIERPATERWLEAALVVDESETMRVWRPAIREFQRLLERHGAFRDVRVWGMNADSEQPALYSRIGRVAPPTQLRDPRELLDAAGRRLIVVLSDCHAPAWQNGQAFRWLADWGREAPVLLVQMLPQPLWEPTAMPQPDARLRADAPGATNAQLAGDRRRAGKRTEVPLPVVVLEDWAILPWAQMIAARGKASAKGFLIPREWPKPEPLESPESDEAQPEGGPRELSASEADSVSDAEDALRRVKSFRASATPAAFRLACHLAAVELNLPVMRLVQQAMLPDSRQSHLAEVLLGGVIRQLPQSVEDAENPDEVLYEFYPRVRETLLTNLYSNPRDTMRVIVEVTRLIENRLPYASEFHAMVALPGAQSDQRVEVGKHAVATISRAALIQLGFGDQLLPPPPPPEPDPVEIARREIESLYRSLDELLERRAEEWEQWEEDIPQHARMLREAMRNRKDEEALHAMASISARLVEIGELDTAFELYSQLKTLGEKQESSWSAAKAHIGFGEIHLARAEADLALAEFDRARELARQAGEAAWPPALFEELARAYRRLGGEVGFERAIECAETAIASTAAGAAGDDRALMARMHALIGAICLESLDKSLTSIPPEERRRWLDRGEKAFSAALAIHRELGDQRGLCNTLLDYGRLLAADNRTERAGQAFNNARDGFVRLADQDGEAAAIGAIGDLHAQNQNHQDAEGHYRQASKLWESLAKPFEQAGALHLMARSAFALDRGFEAVQAGEQALALYSQLAPPPTARIEQLQTELTRWRGATRIADFSFETVTLDDGGKVKERTSATVRLYTELLDDNVELDLVAIPGGTFWMGSSGKEGASWSQETPRHQVQLLPFLIGQVPVTQRQWRVVAGWDRNEKLDLGAGNPALSHLVERDLLGAMSKEKLELDPSRFKGEKLPIEMVSWEQAVRFCAILSAKTGRQYRLPTEAEWEYACRAGTETPFAFGETITPEYVNYDGNYPYAKASKGEYREKTTPVGEMKTPNAWGLYDMHGNVWEWCQDWVSDEYYEKCYRQGVVSDPRGPEAGSAPRRSRRRLVLRRRQLPVGVSRRGRARLSLRRRRLPPREGRPVTLGTFTLPLDRVRGKAGDGRSARRAAAARAARLPLCRG